MHACAISTFIAWPAMNGDEWCPVIVSIQVDLGEGTRLEWSRINDCSSILIHIQ